MAAGDAIPEGVELLPHEPLLDPAAARDALIRATTEQGGAVKRMDAAIAALRLEGASPHLVAALIANRETAYQVANISHLIASTKLRADPPTNPPAPPPPTLRQRVARWIVSVFRVWT